jgi:lipopolysaccharide/colanic/teichoic acid biosynthesis glycosyltransferase
MSSVFALNSGSPTDLPVLPRRLMLRFKLQLLVFFVDLIVIVIGFTLASLVRFGTVNSDAAIPTFAAILSLYVGFAFYGGAFYADTLLSYRRGTYRAVRALVVACLLIVISAYLLKIGEQVSRAILVLGGMLAGANLLLARLIVPFAVRRRWGVSLRSDILIVDAVAPPALEDMFVVDAAVAGLECDLRNPFMLDRLGRLLKGADRVVVACPPDRRRDWAMMLKGANILGEVLAPELDALGPLGTGSFAGSATVMVATGSLRLQQRLLKRALDLTLCCVALVVLAPIMLFVAIAIKVDNRGPIFFVQQRVGRGNELFHMIKFRSMRFEATDHEGARSTVHGDDRVTRVGAVIRSTSIDELPQLINVLTGQMSIVGPRPHALGSLAGDTLFWEVDERYWHRHGCKPGLTGLAQVRGLRGTTHLRSDLVDRLQADLEYNANWTIWKDIAILFATLRVIVHRNAY